MDSAPAMVALVTRLKVMDLGVVVMDLGAVVMDLGVQVILPTMAQEALDHQMASDLDLVPVDLEIKVC